MKKALKVSAVLSWINMIIFGIVVLVALLGALVVHSAAILVGAFLASTVLLHSYAALQLHKSIRDLSIPLSSQTPVGIRFIGFIASFMGAMQIADGFVCLADTKEMLPLLISQSTQSAQLSQPVLMATLRVTGVIVLLLGLSVCTNVTLNFRLLRWYQFMQKEENN